MMKLLPIFTEKSIAEAKKGKYSFWVSPSLNKYQIREVIAQAFDVHPVLVQTINQKGSTRRTMYGKIVTKKPVKKAMVTLRKGEKIDIFETEKGK